MNKSSEPVVLIIEDNKMFRDLAFDVFESTNRIMAQDAEEGLEKFKDHMPDITLLDIGLPGKSGLEILPEMIKYNPESFVVMLTQSNLEKDVKKARSLGAIGYISKPFTYNKVAECMELYRLHKKDLEEKAAEERFNIEKSEEAQNIREEEIKEQKIKDHDELIEDEIKNLSLLFVDDYPSNRFKAQKLLAKMGCRVDIAENGQEAVNKFKKEHYNIILMDSNMPKMNGYEATKSIRKYEKESKLKKSVIIGMPEHNIEIKENLWKEANMDSYITKPAKVYKVKAILKKYIEENIEQK